MTTQKLVCECGHALITITNAKMIVSSGGTLSCRKCGREFDMEKYVSSEEYKKITL